MKLHPIALVPRFTAILLAACAASVNGQDWQVVDTFDGGVPQGTWTAVGTPVVDTSDGFLSLKVTGNSTSTYRVALPETYTSGKVTIAFDFYLPKSPWQNAAGFGIGGAVQAAGTGWTPLGARNRFQAVSPHPQNVAKVPNWESDIFGTTEQGIWYNVWLVYDLGADPKTVTSITKKAVDPMEPQYLITQTFPFDGTGADDWSAVNFFGFGVGFFDAGQMPEGKLPSDTLGLLADNIYVAAGENLTLTPTAYKGDYVKIDTFEDGVPQAEWTIPAGVTGTVTDGALLVKATTANAAMRVKMPTPMKRGSLTLAFDLMLPAGGLNQAVFAVVGDAQLSLTGTSLFGGNDRVFTFGTTAPQKLYKFGALTTDLLGTTQQDQWYHVWMAYDIDAKSLKFYSVPFTPGGDPVSPPAEPTGDFTLVTAYENLSHFVIGGWQNNGVGIKIDNLYHALGTRIVAPSSGVDPEPEPEPHYFLDVGVWNDTPIGLVHGGTDVWGYSPQMGFVHVGFMPWIHQATFGWMSLEATGAEGGLWLHSPVHGWIFSTGYGLTGDFYHSHDGTWLYNNFLDPVP